MEIETGHRMISAVAGKSLLLVENNGMGDAVVLVPPRKEGIPEKVSLLFMHLSDKTVICFRVRLM